jgi:sarcosine oxidase subunit delta
MGFRIGCPNCGERSYTEFWFGGEVPDPRDDDFARAWLRENRAGVQTERWFHAAGCRRWLTLERDTVTNEIQRVLVTRAPAGGT